MNAGMYGMPDGRGMAGRKLAGRVGYGGQAGLVTDSGFRNGTLAQALTSIFAATQARTRVISVMGRGAVRALFVGHVTDQTSGSFNVDVVIDGVLVVSRTGLTLAQYASYGFIFFGYMSGQSPGSTQAGVCPDFVPFDSSFEVFITTNGLGAGTTFNIPHWIDIHQ